MCICVLIDVFVCNRFTPLHQAAQQGHTLIIQLLLKSDADPNALSAVSYALLTTFAFVENILES